MWSLHNVSSQQNSFCSTTDAAGSSPTYQLNFDIIFVFMYLYVYLYWCICICVFVICICTFAFEFHHCCCWILCYLQTYFCHNVPALSIPNTSAQLQLQLCFSFSTLHLVFTIVQEASCLACWCSCQISYI